MSGDHDDAVWADTEVLFDAAAKLRLTDVATSSLELTVPDTGGLWADMVLHSVANGCRSLPGNLVADLETIAKAFTVGAIDAYRADGDD